MIDSDGDTLRTKLEDFSRRLRVRTDEFRRRGEFSDVHQSLLAEFSSGMISLRRSLPMPRKAAITKISSSPSVHGILRHCLTIFYRWKSGRMPRQ